MDLSKIVRLVAVLFAVVAAFVSIPYEMVAIAVLGLAAGFFIEEDRRLPYMVMTLTLALVYSSLNAIPGIGVHLTSALGSVSSLLNAGACTVIVMQIIDRLKP